jgi:hypothetical protein
MKQFPTGWTVLHQNDNMPDPVSSVLTGSKTLELIRSDNASVKIFETIFKRKGESRAEIELVIFFHFHFLIKPLCFNSEFNGLR